MTFFSKRGKASFRRREFCEAAGDVPNPGRGWYHIYTYVLGEGGSCDLPPVLCGQERLALVLIDIGAYRERAITDEGLGLIHRILSCFAESGSEMIVRIVYDTMGKGMEREPSLFSQVQEHIGQLAPLLVRHSSHIFLFQGLLVGSWGEMHTSKFVSEKYLQQMAERFVTLTEGKVRLAVRKPVQCRLVQRAERVTERYIGCFDDAIFASETHMGTFGTLERREAGWRDPWRPEDEIAFMEQLAENVPFGGEALSGEKGMTAADTVKRLGRLHVSYLNCVHDDARLREWKETEYAAGVSLYDHIGMHMGYRFVVEKCTCERRGKAACLTVRLANRGFACCGEEVRFSLCLVQGGEESVIPADCDLGRLEGGKSTTLQIPLEEEVQRSGMYLYGSLQRVRDRGIIVFANEGAGDRLLLGLFD